MVHALMLAVAFRFHCLRCAKCTLAQAEAARLGPNGDLGVLFPCDVGRDYVERALAAQHSEEPD